MIAMRDKLMDIITVGIARYNVKKVNNENPDMAAIIADVLIENGYRKASDVVEEIFAEIGKLRPITKLVIKDLGEWDFDKYGEKFYWLSETKLAELKKKYTEEGK